MNMYRDCARIVVEGNSSTATGFARPRRAVKPQRRIAARRKARGLTAKARTEQSSILADTRHRRTMSDRSNTRFYASELPGERSNLRCQARVAGLAGGWTIMRSAPHWSVACAHSGPRVYPGCASLRS
jgi:hypothetical protein